MNTTRRRTAALALGGMSVAAALTGCASSAPQTPSAATATADSGSGSGSGASGSYKDGSYSAKGSYQSPGGKETIDVRVTLAKNVVTAVTVVGEATDGNAVLYQKQFAGGIADVVVGKEIGSLKVDKVAGSSLTSGGFNEAISAIKADATA